MRMMRFQLPDHDNPDIGNGVTFTLHEDGRLYVMVSKYGEANCVALESQDVKDLEDFLTAVIARLEGVNSPTTTPLQEVGLSSEK
jgi:hypothetical protein